jgi:hypothetical protein
MKAERKVTNSKAPQGYSHNPCSTHCLTGIIVFVIIQIFRYFIEGLRKGEIAMLKKIVLAAAAIAGFAAVLFVILNRGEYEEEI